MAPEHDARTRAFYDHESDEPSGKRRRAAADWGVGEDIFDRMPSRRFKRADRRAEHREEEARRFERRVSGPAHPDAEQRWDDGDALERPAPLRDELDGPERRPMPLRDELDALERRPRPSRDELDALERRPMPSRDELDALERRPMPSRDEGRPRRRPAESWIKEDDASDAGDARRPVQSWLEPERGESRTIVLELSPPPEPAPIEEPPARRTVVISGHPDRLPVLRASRPPRTAIDRIGTSPDRIVAYSVALGFLLILIAVLTTGQ